MPPNRNDHFDPPGQREEGISGSTSAEFDHKVGMVATPGPANASDVGPGPPCAPASLAMETVSEKLLPLVTRAAELRAGGNSWAKSAGEGK